MDLIEQKEDALVALAQESRKAAYAPYSRFYVGAAVLAKSGRMYGGCNIENASYGATNCAERTAMFKSVSEGDSQIVAIAIAGGNDDFLYPCGICRQVMAELGEDMVVILVNGKGERKRHTAKELMPHSFTRKDLKEGANGI